MKLYVTIKNTFYESYLLILASILFSKVIFCPGVPSYLYEVNYT